MKVGLVLQTVTVLKNKLFPHPESSSIDLLIE